jgi:hypothetical protein
MLPINPPMFSSGSGNSISFATVTSSMVIVGDPNFLVSTTLRPLAQRVTFTASATLLTRGQSPGARRRRMQSVLPLSAPSDGEV